MANRRKQGENILICTLGSSWAIVPEAISFVWPELVDLYARHPERETMDESRRLACPSGLGPPDEIWVVTTDGAATRSSLDALGGWWAARGAPKPLRAWVADGTEQLASTDQCERMTELIFRAVLAASERASVGGQLVVCLAGGRKTMSADLQRAAGIFGCTLLMHVVSHSGSPADATCLASGDPLDPKRFESGEITPVIVGTGRRSELLDVQSDESGPIHAEGFRIPVAPPLDGPAGGLRWVAADEDASLLRAIETRERAPLRVIGGYLDRLRRAEHHECWRSAYRLPLGVIDGLRSTPLAASHRPWLKALPQADLHCHIGGILPVHAQREVARAAWDSMTSKERTSASEDVAGLVECADRGEGWPSGWRQLYLVRDDASGAESQRTRTHRTAAVLVRLEVAALERVLYGAAPRVALAYRHPLGFRAYEVPGDLSGSMLLQTEAAVIEYATQVARVARTDRLRYLELRSSPAKYMGGNGRAFVDHFHAALRREQATHPPDEGDCEIRLIWSVERRQNPALVTPEVQAAVEAAEASQGFLLGLDLAGDEASAPARAFSAAFQPAFEACLPLTVHAGENVPPESIWEAAYALHADRIGHGLTLGERESRSLAAKLRNRRVCLEICPTSNREVVGFEDPEVPESVGLPAHPVRELLDLGIPVAICTDNPGISRTDIVSEFLAASRMTQGGLTLWDVLTLTRLSFEHSFLPADERELLVKECDARVFETCSLAPDSFPDS